MQSALQIDFQGMKAQPALREAIEESVAELEERFGRVTSCRVVLKAPSEHHRTGGLYEVNIRLALPDGKEVNIGRTPRADERHADVHFALNDAFKRARRQLQDRVRKLQGQVKLHEADPGVVEATRRAVGDGVALMLDVNCRWPAGEAVGIARRLAPLRLHWVEEPCWPPDPRALAAVARAGCPIAAGENARSLQDLEAMASAAELAYLQPSVAKLGGLSAMLGARGIAALAWQDACWRVRSASPVRAMPPASG